ncbi:hypothetical protein CEXT_548121 [Caerostris extrusa]|uniref:Uncharacterized protein n=1 Tax=Caerostris extrusa TaxID=172846 RepID=A0AAV4YAE4_CAEEX|nr:hypothetical protein CEXT_548121 [Caerostris extrusa]
MSYIRTIKIKTFPKIFKEILHAEFPLVSLYKFRRINQDIKEDGTWRKKSERKTLLCQRKTPLPPFTQEGRKKYSFTETTVDVFSITGSALVLCVSAKRENKEEKHCFTETTADVVSITGFCTDFMRVFLRQELVKSHCINSGVSTRDIKECGTWRKKISLNKFRRINQDIKEDGTWRKKSEKTLLCERRTRSLFPHRKEENTVLQKRRLVRFPSLVLHCFYACLPSAKTSQGLKIPLKEYIFGI